MNHLLGIDIGGTKCACILGKDEPSVIDKTVFLTTDEPDPAAVIQRLCDAARELCRTNSIALENVRAVGISCGGPLDSSTGIVLNPPNLPGWVNIPIVNIVSNELGIPTYLQNDANAGALAEWQWGAGRGTRNMVFLTFGTGMGAGLILNGQLYAGTNDLAGEVGHIRLSADGPDGFGKHGSFEGWASGGGMAKLAGIIVRSELQRGTVVGFCPDEAAAERLTAKNVADAAANGDPVAREIFEMTASYLGRGLATIVDMLNPERIVIGSIFLRCETLLRPAMEKTLAEEAIPMALERCSIVPAGLGEAIGDYASLAVALYGNSSK